MLHLCVHVCICDVPGVGSGCCRWARASQIVLAAALVLHLCVHVCVCVVPGVGSGCCRWARASQIVLAAALVLQCVYMCVYVLCLGWVAAAAVGREHARLF